MDVQASEQVAASVQTSIEALGQETLAHPPLAAEKAPEELAPTASMAKKRLWRTGIIIGGIGAAIALGLHQRLATQPPTRAAAPLTVEVMTLKPVQSYPVLRFYTGEVVATRRSDLGFEQGGQVIEISVDRGDVVEAGAVLARLDTRNLAAQLAQLEAQRSRAMAQLQELQNGPRHEVIAAAQAEVSSLEQQLRLQDLRRDRRQSLYQEGAISREQLDEVSFNRSALADRLAASRSQLAELQNGTRYEQLAAQRATVAQLEASIQDVKISIDKSVLRAPFRGVVGQRNLDEGTVVQPGQAVLRLVENLNPEVEIGVPPQVASTLTPGSLQTVQVGDRTYRAKVLALKPETNPQSLTRTVVLQLGAVDRKPNSALNQKMPAAGEIARLQVTQTVAVEGFWLPTTALVRGERGLWSVFVVGKQNHLQRRDVEVLHTEGDRMLVRGTIAPRELVVTSGTHRLVSGQVVGQVINRE